MDTNRRPVKSIIETRMIILIAKVMLHVHEMTSANDHVVDSERRVSLPVGVSLPKRARNLKNQIATDAPRRKKFSLEKNLMRNPIELNRKTN